MLCGIDKLVFGYWLGKKNKKFKTFADYSCSWLSLSYRLPGKMKKGGMKYWWIGIPLMLVSPAALVTYTTVCVVQEELFPFPLDDDKVPYKEYKDIVAITGLDDFPSFVYRGNSVKPVEHDIYIKFDFEKELSPEYIKKLKTLCTSDDSVYWTTIYDSCFVFQRAWDGEFITSPVSDVQCEPHFAMTVTREGFTIQLGDRATVFCLEEFADRKTLDKNTGVTFPSCRLVNFSCQSGPPDAYGSYTLLLDKKPSKEFVKQLETSKKWQKRSEGVYACSYPTSDSYGVCITVGPDSRVILAEYGQWIGHSGD